VKRVIGRVVAVVAAVAAFSGCVPQLWVHTTAKAPADVTASSVQYMIDQQYKALLSSFPELHAGPSTCPENLDLTAGKVAHCSLTISGAVLPIAVTARKTTDGLEFRPEGVLLSMRRIERELDESMSRDYGTRLALACAPPAVRVVAVGTRIRCALSGARVRHVEMKVAALDGKLYVYRLPGMRRSFDRFGPYLTAHKHGKPARVPGTAIERLISESGVRAADGTRLSTTAVCPTVLDLSGPKHARCTVSAAGHRLAYDAWIDEPEGIHVAPLQVVMSTKRVRLEAVRQLQEKLRRAGAVAMVSVDCGPDRLAVYAPHDTFPCTVTTSDGTRRPLIVNVLDVSGGFNYDVPPLPEK
jgi:hypothetical protein